MIVLEDLAKRYETPDQAPVTALLDLNLTLGPGETLCLIGPSGCGKTTTLRLINRLEEPSAGRVLIKGRDAGDIDPVRLRRTMGYVVQSGALFPHLSVGDNIGLLCQLEGWQESRIRDRVEELLQLVQLDPSVHRTRYPAQLSGGQRQRVGVARALALDPPILLLDEPFGALDPITRRELQDEFLTLLRTVDKTVVVVTHDLEEAFLLGDRVALLIEGRLAQIGTEDDFRKTPASPWVERFVARHRHAP